MTRLVAVVVALLLAASIAWAAEIEGKIKAWNATTNMVTLEDGTQLSVPADAKVARDLLKEGATVKASYEEKDGQKVAKSFTVMPPAPAPR